jgi:nitrous oxidase accessory protein NosD
MKWIFSLLIAVMLFTACSTVKLSVNEFSANPTEVEKGGKTTLTWNLEGEGNFEVFITKYYRQ